MAEKIAEITVSGQEAQWEWEGDRNIWQQYPVEVQQEISKAFDAGETEIYVDITEALTMTIDFEEMVQINKKSKCVRSVRLALSSDDSPGFFVYQWQDEKKKWNCYSAKTMIEIGKALNKNETEVEITSQGRSYSIDLKKLIQTNKTTKVTRKVQKIKSMAKLPTESKKRQAESDVEPKSKKQRAATSSGEEPSTSSIRTVTTIAGQAPVDEECTSLAATAHVYSENGDIFNCTLNQTNIGNNNNKFYLIQLLEENLNKKFHIWLRWGRVGSRGQTSLQSFAGNLNDAKRCFCQKFQEKTSNDFYQRQNFVKHPGKYDFVQLDFNPELPVETEKKNEISQPIPVSKLDQRVQDLIKLICDVRAMEEMLIELKFDAKKNPLGKLSVAQIKSGYAALKKIEDFINASKFGAAFVEANNDYYTRIPHEFGRHVPPLIKTEDQLKREIDLLDELLKIEAGFKCLKNDESERVNPIDQKYEKLKCQLEPVDPSEEIFQIIDKYLQTTHASTHQQYKMEIEQIFRVQRENEENSFKDVGNKMLLWHGSRLTNFAGILSQGLRIAPPEAPVTGYMFGKGVYFADMSSKSANYCFPSKTKSTGLLLLSEVSLGKFNELYNADFNADKLPAGTSSVKGVGSVGPNSKNFVQIDGNLQVPMGPAETFSSSGKTFTLNYNEFIVYDTKQVRMRYLLKIKFLFK